uniref:Uncharacterized protein n=1 Tax=Aegilops tauschii TaxID=37682 RepID=M8BJQ3_AEGTA
MQPSRVADFGALAHSAGFRIEDLANFSTSMSLFSQSVVLETYPPPLISVMDPVRFSACEKFTTSYGRFHAGEENPRPTRGFVRQPPEEEASHGRTSLSLNAAPSHPSSCSCRFLFSSLLCYMEEDFMFHPLLKNVLYNVDFVNPHELGVAPQEHSVYKY